MSEENKKKIMLIFGTRPDAVKMCPLVRELAGRESFDITVTVTGQHRQMLDQVLGAFDITPDYDLSLMRENQSISDISCAILYKLPKILSEVAPDLVLVHGDTTTALTSALAAFYQGIPVGHVEAGLRTYDLSSPFPEEFNRQATSLIARWHFAPTLAASANLIREGRHPENVFVTGNTVIDALKTTVRQSYSHPILDCAAGGCLVLMTAHRRENQGQTMRGIFRAVCRVVSEHPDVHLVYPVHKNPAIRAEAAAAFSGCQRIMLTEPMDLLDFHNFLAKSYLVLTDSGGIQEEAPSLGVPVLVLRETTERPEGLAAGTLLLAGTGEEDVYRHFTRLLDDSDAIAAMRKASNPYGDGRASVRIADILENILAASGKEDKP